MNVTQVLTVVALIEGFFPPRARTPLPTPCAGPHRPATDGQRAPAGRPPQRIYPGRVLDYFFTGLLAALALLIAWFAGYLAYKLYESQR